MTAYSFSLEKALHDPFEYMLGTKSGLVFRFIQAEIRHDCENQMPAYQPGWVHLVQAELIDIVNDQVLRKFERGVDVLIDDISWTADSPDGS